MKPPFLVHKLEHVTGVVVTVFQILSARALMRTPIDLKDPHRISKASILSGR